MNRYLLTVLLSFTIFSFITCAKTPELQAVNATKSDVELTVTSVTSGTVEAEKEAQLAFGAVGRVASLNVKEGSRVKKDETLAEIENTDLMAALVQAEHDYKRATTLRQSSVLAPQELERARESFDMAKGIYEKTIIRAPFDGMITEVNLEVGQLSQITTISPKALLRIVDMSPRYISTDIDEVDLPRMHIGLPARIKILAVRREPFNGVVRQVIPYVSAVREQDRTSRIELSIDDEGALLPPGASADVEIIAEKRPLVLAVPSRTILGRGNDRFVFTLVKGKAHRAPITIGIGNYEKTEITSGIEIGETVLIPSDKVVLIEGLSISAQVLAWP
jgi:HlyD family secretion protein